MVEFLTANLGTIVVGAVLLAIVALIIVNMVKDKKKGKNSCGCGCSNCPSSGICHKR